MRCYFKEDFHFLYGEGKIYNDETEELLYTFEQKTLMLPSLYLYDRSGKTVGHIETELTFMLSRYDIFLGDRFIDSLQEQFTFFRHELDFDSLGWRIDGDFLAMNYTLIDERDRVLCKVHQEFFHLTKQFTIDIYDEDNADVLLLIVLAVYQYDRKVDSASSSASHSANH